MLPEQSSALDRLIEVTGPLVQHLRECYPLTDNPDLHARMTAAITAYEERVAELANAPRALDDVHRQRPRHRR